MLELSKNNVRFNLEKLKDIESLLLEEMPSIDVLWAGKKVAIIKINKVEKMFLIQQPMVNIIPTVKTKKNCH